MNAAYIVASVNGRGETRAHARRSLIVSVLRTHSRRAPPL